MLDNSVKAFAMSFGWAISTPAGIRLATAGGTYGVRQNSLWSEAVRMLSISLYFALLTTHFEFDSVEITFVSDNLELIKRRRTRLEYTNPYPNTKFVFEYELTE